MNIITTLPRLNWRPLLTVPEPHVVAFKEWRAAQVEVNERIKQCKNAALTMDEQGSAENEIMSIALLTGNMHERLTIIAGEILQGYGWNLHGPFTIYRHDYDPIAAYRPIWRLENNHPWPDDDNTPIMRPEEYSASISTNNPADIIAALSQVPPKWLSPKLVEVHAGAGAVRFECGG